MIIIKIRSIMTANIMKSVFIFHVFFRAHFQCLEAGVRIVPSVFLWVCLQYDHVLREMTFGKGHDVSLGHGQQWCVHVHCIHVFVLDMETDYVCTATLRCHDIAHCQTLMDNNCERYPKSIEVTYESLWPRREFCLYALWPRDMTLGHRQ